MSKLFDAVVNKNVPEVKEILKQCTQDILEYRGREVFFFPFLFVVFARSSFVLEQLTNPKNFCSSIALYVFILIPFTILSVCESRLLFYVSLVL